MNKNTSQYIFPEDFKFGVADADLQVIGEKHTLENENSLETMWHHFAKQPGKVYEQHSTDEGVDRYHKWKEDIRLIKQLNVKDYRTSISMSRTLTQDMKPNEKALQWYKDYFQELRNQGITIYATLYHWELPQFLSAKGGWKNKESIVWLVEHAKVVYQYLNEYIEEYFILNEPWCSTFFSYHTGDHAPGEKDLKGTLQTVHNILLAQGLVYKELRNLDKDIKLSTVYNPVTAYADSASKKDLEARKHSFGYYTSWFTDPLYLGKYPEYMMDIFGEHMPDIQDGDMEIIKIGDKLHSFGVNYYYSSQVKHKVDRDIKFEDIIYDNSIFNGLKWPTFIPPIYQEGFYDLVKELYHRYEEHGMKRMYITENGTAWPSIKNDKGEIDDSFRIFYLQEHIKQIHKAITGGVPIQAYFEWTLMDNYEWQFGYLSESCFGLVYVDRQTMERIPKKSFHWYSELVKTNTLHVQDLKI